MHLFFEFDGKKFAVPYIRKNGSSNFKRWLTSAVCGGSADNAERIQILSEQFSTTSMLQVQQADIRLFIYRDPAERAVSAFKDKFIRGTGNKKISEHYEAITNKNWREATFRDFVFDYIGSNRRYLDAHLMLQVDHLFPINYTHVINLRQIHEFVSSELNKPIADQYFSKAVNGTHSAKSQYTRGAYEVPAWRLWETCGGALSKLPSTESFMCYEIEMLLRNVYAKDYRAGTQILER